MLELRYIVSELFGTLIGLQLLRWCGCQRACVSVPLLMAKSREDREWLRLMAF